MKVAIEAQRIFRHNIHGMDVFAINLINELVQLDGIEKIYALVNANKEVKKVLLEHPKLEVICFKASYPIWEQILLPIKLQSLEVDIVHFTANTRSLFVKTTSLTTLHDVFFLDANPLFRKGYSLYQRYGNFYRRLLFLLPVIRKSTLVTVSNSERLRMIQEHALDVGSYIYNGLNKKFKVIPEKKCHEVLSAFKIKYPFILHLGNKDPKKNTIRSLQAIVSFLSSNQDYYSVIVDYQEEGKALFENLVVSEDIKDRLILLDFVPQSVMPYLYNAAHVLLYPSIQESFGIPQIEAMACETTVVSGNCAALIEVTKGAAIHVDPLDIHSLIKGLNDAKTLNNSREFIERGASVAKMYNWSNTAKEYLKEYQKLCSI